jgi:hypothetical protein
LQKASQSKEDSKMIHFLSGYVVGSMITVLVGYAGFNWQENKPRMEEEAPEKKAPYMDLDD